MQFRPGPARPSYKDRCATAFYRCLIEQFGEYDAYICGQKVILKFDEEGAKESFGGGGLEIEVERLTIKWMADDYRNARAGDPVWINGTTYKIKSGFPVLRKRCVYIAELDCCETCR